MFSLVDWFQMRWLMETGVAGKKRAHRSCPLPLWLGMKLSFSFNSPLALVFHSQLNSHRLQLSTDARSQFVEFKTYLWEFSTAVLFMSANSNAFLSNILVGWKYCMLKHLYCSSGHKFTYSYLHECCKNSFQLNSCYNVNDFQNRNQSIRLNLLYIFSADLDLFIWT